MSCNHTNQDMVRQACQVLVIGGGPAGSTVSSLLRDRGLDVVLLEKDQHPRFHIGESLLPMNLEIFEELGVLDQVASIGLLKNGAEFISADDRQHTFYFKSAMNKSAPGHAYQIRRSEFDKLLLDNSRKKGVRVFQNTRVIEVSFQPETVEIKSRTEQGEIQCWRAEFIVDASGRNTYLANALKLKQKNRSHNSAAIFGHFTAVERRVGSDEGNISIYWFDYGWFWMIPLADGCMSVGAVCEPAYLKRRKSSPEVFLQETIERCSGVRSRMKNARLVGCVNATGNYSYSSKKTYGERFLLVGDAYAFVDPVFSSGVFIAMSAGRFAASAVYDYLQQPEKGTGPFERYQRQVRKGIKTVSWFIYRFNTPAMRSLFMAPRNLFRIEEAVISMLAGDIYGDTPIRSRIYLFKLIYYLFSLKRILASLRSYRCRHESTGKTFNGGTLDVD